MKKLKSIYLALILFFLYAPIVVLVVFSFNASRSRGVWAGFTLDWYRALFRDTRIMRALYNTLLVGVLSALISTVIGTMAAIGINNMGRKSRRLIMNITNIPVFNPDVVIGVSLMLLYVTIFSIFRRGELGFITLLIAHISFSIPYIILSVLPKLRRLNKSLFEAAIDLGAKPAYAFFKVILPEISPGILTGMILAFTMSIDDFLVSFFTTGPESDTLSVVVFSMARRGVNPSINALSTLMLLVVLILLFIINLRDKKRLTE
ncbi:MAG: ABC transporter permease [Defluviitaleaceae bacterium]|nr:ABC transporter permease [Defluviitaleaceae bacterium]